MPITPDHLVAREVFHTCSYLVATLSNNQFGVHRDAGELAELCQQASDLACPIDDWEEAAFQAGWKTADLTPGALINESMIEPGATLCEMFEPAGDGSNIWRDVCEAYDIEPYQREIFEHWIISDWLADKLEAEGEKVDRDFAGLTVWARTTCGQLIAADGVIERICAQLPDHREDDRDEGWWRMAGGWLGDRSGRGG